MGGFEELCRQVQVAVNSVVANVNKVIQALKASEATKDAKIQAYGSIGNPTQGLHGHGGQCGQWWVSLSV